MESLDVSYEETCETLLNVVVESRKIFGKLCSDYDKKTSLVENKMLNFQLESVSNYRVKTKDVGAPTNVDEMNQDFDRFSEEILQRNTRIERLRRKLIDTQNIVNQLKTDTVSRKLQLPMCTDILLSQAKTQC